MDFFGEHSVQVLTTLSQMTPALVAALVVSAMLGLVLLLSDQAGDKPIWRTVPQHTGIQRAVRSLAPHRDDVLTCLPTRAPPLPAFIVGFQRPGPSQPPGIIPRR